MSLRRALLLALFGCTSETKAPVSSPDAAEVTPFAATAEVTKTQSEFVVVLHSNDPSARVRLEDWNGRSVIEGVFASRANGGRVEARFPVEAIEQQGASIDTCAAEPALDLRFSAEGARGKTAQSVRLWQSNPAATALSIVSPEAESKLDPDGARHAAPRRTPD
ncbi:MAG: hypothetical protein HY791_32775 [Deltaproteobacteria bacterium]|nr:hypothetical protein [Deltaproteobacteria bacterium]